MLLSFVSYLIKLRIPQSNADSFPVFWVAGKARLSVYICFYKKKNMDFFKYGIAFFIGSLYNY